METKRKTQNANRKTGAERKRRFTQVLFCVVSFAFCVFLAGCYERRQETVLNPDGSGKMLIETDVAVPAVGATVKDKPTAVGYGRLFAADLVNSAAGMDAWSNLEISEAADGRAHVAIVGYFKDINSLRFKQPLDLPLMFTWKLEGQDGTLTVERIHQTEETGSLSEAKAKEMVGQAQADYKDKRMAMQTQLNAFKMRMVFQLPGEVTGAHVFEKSADAKGTVSLTLDGKKIAAALDAFMANDKALQAMFEKGEDSDVNDDLMLMSMMNEKGPVTASVRVATIDGARGMELKTAFDYKTEMRTAELGQEKMFAAAGVELIPKFIVKPETAPGR